VVHDQLVPEPTSNRHTDSRLYDHLPCVLGTRPGHLRRLWPGDAHSRVSRRCRTALQHCISCVASVTSSWRPSFSCSYCSSSQKAGLRQRNTDRPADPPYPSPSVCAERCGSTDILSPLIWPHHGRAHQPTLVMTYECPKGSCSRSQCRLTGHCMVMLLSTYGSLHQSPTSRPDKDSGLPPRTICAFLLSDCLLLDVVLSVTGARVWNALPADITSAPSLLTFRKHLKLHLFPLPKFLSWPCPLNPFSPCVVLVVAVCYLGHPKIDWLKEFRIQLFSTTKFYRHFMITRQIYKIVVLL